jgi:hypothetical protein
MAALLHIAGIETEVIRRDYCVVRVRLENIGTRVVGPGVLNARQTSEDGSVRLIEFFNAVTLAPSDRARLSQLVSGFIKSIEFKNYKESEGETIPVTGLVRRSVLSFAEAAETFFHEFLVPVYETVTTKIQHLPKAWVKRSSSLPVEVLVHADGNRQDEHPQSNDLHGQCRLKLVEFHRGIVMPSWKKLCRGLRGLRGIHSA